MSQTVERPATSRIYTRQTVTHLQRAEYRRQGEKNMSTTHFWVNVTGIAPEAVRDYFIKK